MAYWCYFIDSHINKLLNRIKEHRVITFPRDKNYIEGDVIIIYKTGKHSGFLGYIRLAGKAINNLTKGKPKYTIFDDITFSSVYAPLKTCNLFEEVDLVNKKKNIVGEIEQFIKEFNKCLLTNEMLLQLSDELGEHLRFRIRKNLSHPHVDIEPKHKPPKPIVEKPIITSKYLIPILVIPCKQFKKDIAPKITKDVDTMLLYEHIEMCRRCNIINNNERITIDRLKTLKTKYRPLETHDDVVLLEKMMYNLEYCTSSSLRLVLIDDIESKHNKCYFIVGMMDKEY